MLHYNKLHSFDNFMRDIRLSATLCSRYIQRSLRNGHIHWRLNGKLNLRILIQYTPKLSYNVCIMHHHLGFIYFSEFFYSFSFLFFVWGWGGSYSFTLNRSYYITITDLDRENISSKHILSLSNSSIWQMVHCPGIQFH